MPDVYSFDRGTGWPRLSVYIGTEEAVRTRVCSFLARRGTQVVQAADLESAQKLLQSGPVDLVITDLEPASGDGFELCRALREKYELPLIVISGRGEIIDCILSLELGADDYLKCPFDERELNARIRALLRRCAPLQGSSRGQAPQEQSQGPRAGTMPASDAASPAASSPLHKADAPAGAYGPGAPKQSMLSASDASSSGKILVYPGLTVNLDNYTVICRGKPVPMPRRELELLYFLASSPNQVFSREQLLDKVWGYDYVGNSRTVDVHIKRLRQKTDGGNVWSIATVNRVGYKFALKTD